MDDEHELKLLGSYPELESALRFLQERVIVHWRAADAEALRAQGKHKQVARISIAAGTASIIFAICELTTELTLPTVAWLPRLLGQITVLLTVIAVGIGLATKYAAKWLGHRHLAERLRMLRFRALQQLCCLNDAAWRAWVDASLEELKSAVNKVEEWTGHEDVAFEELPSTRAIAFGEQLAALYLVKRLQYQAGYFKKTAAALKQRVGWWKRSSLPLFIASILCVLANFGIEWVHGPKALSYWLIALAAIISVVGVGVRVALAAFELPRSATLYAAKSDAVERAARDFENDSADPARMQQHMAQNERFLEHEHREWLRLVNDSEWFL